MSSRDGRLPNMCSTAASRMHFRGPAVAAVGIVVLLVGASGVLAVDSESRRMVNVRIGPLSSAAEVDAVVGRLRSEGIDCARLPQASGGEVEISVGVFADPANARRMEERVRALGLGPVRIVPTGRAAPGTEPPPAHTATEHQPSTQRQGETPLYEVRYGWFANRDQAVAAYHALEDAGFSPRLLEFASSPEATLGVGVFASEEEARRLVATLTDGGFPDARVYPVPAAEAEARGLEPGAGPSPPPEPSPRTATRSPEEPPAPSASPRPEAAPEATSPAAAASPGLEMEVRSPAAAPTPPPLAPGLPLQPSPNRLGLREAIEYARLNSPELEGEGLRVDLAEVDLRRAWGLVQPKILFEHQSTRIDDDTVAYFNTLPDGVNQILGGLGIPITVPPFVYREAHHTQVLLSQNLFSGGANRFRISSARANRDAARSRASDVEADVLMRVSQAFFGLARQAEVVSLRQESLARAQRALESVERRFSLGLVARAEVLRWKVQVSGERVQLIEARNLYEVGLEHFKRLIGYPPSAALSPVFPSEVQVQALMDDGIERLRASGQVAEGGWLDEHPAVIAARDHVEAARFGRRAATAAFWPTLDLDGSVGYLENDTLQLDQFLQWSARLRLTVPLWDGGARIQNRAEASTMEDLARLDLQVVRDDLFVQDRSVVADLRADLASLETARAAVAQARETMESVTNKAALGLVDYLQRIDAQVIVTSSEVAETSARYQFIIDLLRWWRVRDPDRLRNGMLP